jgi:hypothetical protein
MLIYLVIALDLPQWAHKIRQNYYWRGHKEEKGGHCLIAWDTVCQPIELGGLGISNLRNLSWALRVRWLWLQKIEPHRPWSTLSIQVPDQVLAFFPIAITSEAGNGEHTIFWTNRWLQGKSIAEIAPLLFAAIPQRKRQKRTMQEALPGHVRTVDI